MKSKTWLKAAGVRAVKTIAQTLVATIGSAAVLEAVDWKMAVSAAVLAGVLSLLTSIAGLPELKTDDDAISEADAVNAMVTDQPTTDADNAAEIVAKGIKGVEK
jgi:hydroxymethylglutaryl-CoA reductase